jgi:hypothetical protein
MLQEEAQKHTPWITSAATVYLVAVWNVTSLVPTYLLRTIAVAIAPIIPALVFWFMPRSTLKTQVLSVLRRLLLCSWLYSLITAAGAVLVILCLSSVGYLSYSDRPGPGWGKILMHMPGMDEISYFAGWALLALPGSLLWGSLFFLFVSWIGWFGAPRWLLRVFGGLFCGALTLLLIDAVGWYIALAAAPIWTCGLLGFLFGTFLLSKFATPAERHLSFRVRLGAISAAVLCMAAAISAPFWVWRL